MTVQSSTGRRIHRIATLAIATTFLSQNFAWAVCSDGLPMPPGINGYVHGNLPANLQNMAPGIFTGTAGSVFIPDNSLTENNSPTGTTTTLASTPPLPTVIGGHNWQFDQGSTTCKAADVGVGGQPATGWSISPNTTSDCFVLPIVKGGKFTNFGNIPLQGQEYVTSCDPTKLSAPLAPNPLNTRNNQLGCSISQLFTGVTNGVASDVTTAPAYLFVAGIQGGLFAEELENTPNTAVGDAGRVTASIRYYADIPEGQKLTNAAVDSTAHFAVVTSIRRNVNVFACNNPLGDPGDITQPLPSVATFAQSFDSRSGVKCLSSVGNNGLSVDLTTGFGPDDQPYFGGQRTVTSFNPNPGSKFVFTAWPQCIVSGGRGGGLFTLGGTQAQVDAALNVAFTNHQSGGCGTAIANAGFSATPIIQPQALTRYTAPNGNMYMFTAGVAQPVQQFRLTISPADGSTHYTSRTYMSGGTGFVTGLGVAPDMSWGSTTNSQGLPATGTTGSGSLIVMQDPTGLGLAGQEVMTKLPLCEDF